MGPYQSSGPRAKGLTQGAVYEMVKGKKTRKTLLSLPLSRRMTLGKLLALP